MIKEIYGRPFRNETRSITSIIAYRLALKAISAAYAVKHRKTLKRTADFLLEYKKEVIASERSAFVFANGPSLSDIDLRKIDAKCKSGKYDLISINQFLSKSTDLVAPKFAIFADSQYFSGEKSKYTNDIDICKRYGVTYFVPAHKSKGGDALQMSYCGLCNIDSNSIGNILRPAGYYGVTAFFAISLAKSLGYKNIYICGFDNSYFKDFEVSDNNEMQIRHKHYYDKDGDETIVPCLYDTTSGFFFDTYRHFKYLEKISDKNIINVARKTYLSSIKRDTSLDIYKDQHLK